VEIDPATGAVASRGLRLGQRHRPRRQPGHRRGQIEGGAVQGIGQALCERMAYDRESGQLLSASFMDYAMPRADGFLGFKTKFDTSIPCKNNALGVKGVGELGTIGATPAVVNAVVDALATPAWAPAAARSARARARRSAGVALAASSTVSRHTMASLLRLRRCTSAEALSRW
jgi:carbon-monoxide dehydrogenase large subunit